MWGIDRVRGVDDVAVGRGVAVPQQALALELSAKHGWRLGPPRRGGSDEPDVVEERTAERRLEEVVAKSVVPSEPAEREGGAVLVAHPTPAGIAEGDELVHLPAVDLEHVLVVAMHGVASQLVRRDVTPEIERRHREVGRNPGIRRPGRLAVVDGRGKRGVELAVLVDLADGVERVGETVGSGERAEETVERPVLLVDDDEVVDHLDGTLGPGVARPSRTSDERPAEAGGGGGRTDAKKAAPCDVVHEAGL